MTVAKDMLLQVALLLAAVGSASHALRQNRSEQAEHTVVRQLDYMCTLSI